MGTGYFSDRAGAAGPVKEPVPLSRMVRAVKDLVLVTDARPFADDVKHELAQVMPALERRGLRVRTGGWDDPKFDWSSVELAVLRTPWNYHRHLSDFLAWTKRVPRLLNPPDVVAWNAVKTYLRDLSARGIPMVPTEWLEREVPLDEVLARRGWSEAVLKPAVSAGSFRTRRFARGDAPQALLREILSEGTAMLQPYLPSVESSGERSLVFFASELSHVVKRHPPLITGLHGGISVPVEPDELELAQRILATQPALLYARVDLARDGSGAPVLMELELIEPSLFLETSPGASDRYADAVLRAAAA